MPTRSELINKAASLPVGNPERKRLLAGLSKESGHYTTWPAENKAKVPRGLEAAEKQYSAASARIEDDLDKVIASLRAVSRLPMPAAIQKEAAKRAKAWERVQAHMGADQGEQHDFFILSKMLGEWIGPEAK
jgi:hypothetical protein